mmetsp:Transcript_13119/g.22159  ORF Transcript_13119/g.22159 Transcript_13119/m.22159 type:complete len:90 (-) Transcript_13119:285-554(-)|eukprot:CAMPEP_0168610680 /NCGR_PEP_ID=MMETSP0449_2-20121227/1920_1 /TAXON_ID=1082188 /ORGANISM="Strombidium rassoulzadegani, Strain ras09" /LENGTH=89 /DNA_ID=CAMNT_0008651009 /DNA_START=617 /DNA_END=886 /DNA_ORIENTATION=-
MSVVGKGYLEKFHIADYQLMNSMMCRSDFCPCSDAINATLYGERSGEFSELTLGSQFSVTQFYDDCYLEKVNNGDEIKQLSSAFTDLLR